MKPPICRVCGKSEWGHVCGGPLPLAARAIGGMPPPEVLRGRVDVVPPSGSVGYIVGPMADEGEIIGTVTGVNSKGSVTAFARDKVRQMSDDELRPYVREWERRRKAKGREK